MLNGEDTSKNAYSMDALVQSGLLTATADYGNTYGYFLSWAFEITDGAFFGMLGPIIITS